MEGEYGWGSGSTLALLVVVAIIFLVPLGMGPLHPPSALLLLLFPVILVAVLYILHSASK
ncbi:hypothetical protein K2173_011047 [Erythroxylum novogranatense]|uniref:Transmembrane protein n=1 Tax=Erythroxylum novogranatense TaxID=1862640 RepID=A0AAV8T0B7_9ROSI|nr:hypothetical protein K2173_011047 [Erythroxylum novogranatense]